MKNLVKIFDLSQEEEINNFTSSVQTICSVSTTNDKIVIWYLGEPETKGKGKAKTTK